MKILIIASDNIPHVGGKSTHIYDLKDGLEKLGNDVDIVSYASIPKPVKLITETLFKLVRIVNKQKYYILMQKVKINLLSLYLKYFYKKDIDIISGQDTHSILATKYVYKNTPKVLTMHTYFAIEPTLDGGIIIKDSKYYKELLDLELSSIKYLNKIICVDNRIKEHVKEFVKEEKIIESIMNFTNTDKYSPVSVEEKNSLKSKYGLDKYECIITCTRRLVEKNGVKYAVESIKHLSNNKSVLLLIIGDGQCKDSIIEKIEQLNLKDKIKLIGSIDNELILEYYLLSDIVLVPSITVNNLQEATSISAIEAMSCGIPVVASEIGGLKELINNNTNGILVAEKNSEDIAKACSSLMINNGYREAISKNARESIVKEHSHLNVAKKFNSIFETIR